jgi:signal transduction histidine kinase
MSNRTKPWRLSLAAAVAIGAVTAFGIYLMWRNRAFEYANDYFLFALFSAASAAYVAAGLAIVRKAHAHVIGWLCLMVAAALQLSLSLTQYGIFGIRTNPGSLPSPSFALVVARMMPLFTLGGIILILHLFPTGRPAGQRWRPFLWLSVACSTVMAITALLSSAPITDVWSDELSHAGVSATNPVGISAVSTNGPVPAVVLVLFTVGAVAAIASLFMRRRRATPDERLQLRWLAAVAGAALIWITVMLPIMLVTDPEGAVGALFWIIITPLIALGPPAAIGIGIVKYRLFDIDVVIRKAVLVTVVAVALTTLYLAVLALATLSQVSRLVVGIALLAVTFNPVRRAARSIADRVAYGRRASSYEVLADFSDRVAEAYATDDVLPRMAAILVSGTGARSATVWLRIGNELVPAASAGDASASSTPLAIVGGELPPLPGHGTEVRHQGELLGALSVSMPENDPLDGARERLIRDLASQAGLVLRNVRLIEELRGSRQRLVSAQDEERRKIERNIHDGVQQQLVAMNVQLGLLARAASTDPKVAEMATDLQTRVTGALEDLRDLARGIYPPLLADRGLAAALDAQARKAAVSVTIDAEPIGRFPQDVEATVYFCALEALNNVAKYADASRATIRLTNGAREVRFEVEDDGRGFDPRVTSYGTGLQGMADRLAAVGGQLEVDSEPGHGTRVAGTVPAGASGPRLVSRRATSGSQSP